MLKQFTAENLAKLQELYTKFSFSGDILEGKFGANTLNPFELLNTTSVTTLRNLRTTLLASINTANFDEWSLTKYQKEKQTRLENWSEFLNLLVGYRLNEEENKRTAAEKAKVVKELKQRIELEKDKNKSVDDLMKELAALEA